MNKISVFGGTGFIGKTFNQLYSDQVILIPRESRESCTNNILYFISTTTNQNVFKDLHIDIDTNLNLLMEVLLKCKGKDVTFNFVSSCFVYGNNVLNAKESDCCNPTGFYSITKRCAEQLLISFCNTFNIKYRIFRIGNVYGLDPTVSSGKNVLGYMITLLKRNEDIKLYDGGNYLKDYIFVEDVCKYIKLLIDNGNTNEIYNIASGKSQIFKDVILKAREIVNSSSKLIDVETPVDQKYLQIKNMTLNIDKLKEYGYSEIVDLDKGLIRMCEIY
jgi:nucleoside-diphosphate-sugar epimerase